ncbi:6361_t:CDS:2, partial [Gigaspora rosea]
MILEKSFQKYRKTEPLTLFILRLIVLILLLVSLFGYTLLIIWGIYNDNPVIQNSLAIENSFPVPFLYIYTFQQTNINCNFENASGTHDCTKYVIQPQSTTIDGVDAYSGNFSADELIFSATPN